MQPNEIVSKQPAGSPTKPTAPIRPYSSNPFTSTMKGLGQLFTTNPLSTLTYGVLLFLYLFVGILGLVLLFLIGSRAGVGTLTDVLVGVVILVLLIGFVLKLTASTIMLYLSSQAGVSVTGRELVSSKNQRLPSLFAALVITAVLVFIGSILFIIPGIIIASRLAFVGFVFYKENLDAWSAVKRSWALTKGHTWEMLGVGAAQMIVVGGSGGLLSIPGSVAGYANRYDELTEYERAQQSTGKTHPANYWIVLLFALAVVGYIVFVAISMSSVRNDYKNTQNTDNTNYSNNLTNVTDFHSYSSDTTDNTSLYGQ